MTPKDIHEFLVIFGFLGMIFTAAQFGAAVAASRSGLAAYLSIVQFLVIMIGTVAAYVGYEP